MNKQDLIDALSSEYGEDRVRQVIDGMIQEQGLDSENLPQDFGNKVLDSFIILEDQQNSLPSSSTGSQITVTRPNSASIQKAESMGISQEMLSLAACVVFEDSAEEISKILDVRDGIIQRKIASRNLDLVKQISNSFSKKDPDFYEKLAVEFGLTTEQAENQQKKEINFLQKLVEERELQKKKRQQREEEENKRKEEREQEQQQKQSEILARFYQSLRNTPTD